MPQDLVEPEELTLEDGEFLVKLARESVEKYFVNETPDFSRVPEKLRKKGAAFVTIEKIIGDKKQLRGCIGYVEPIKPLYKTVYEVALAAAFEDPRFPPVRASELPFLVYEVSVLSSIKKLMGRPEERPRLIKIGKMGLIAKKGFFSGLLLPQVPVEEGWDEETFLAYTCLKAGLSSDCWLDESVEFYYFTARVFSEEYPNGRVVEKELGK
ncbi:MAG: TIGR00296 family protein [Fervidicoccaceae archaeon]|jgi:uncharacterized protein (TIGR00296 family)|nr:TIGR00296 family protein [Fervidicoccaceae archaeon]